MDVICEKHGMQPTIHVSRDVLEDIDNENYKFSPVLVFFEFDDEIVEVFYLTSEYAAKFNLQNKEIISLPDEYPQWVLNLRPVCKECLRCKLGEEYFYDESRNKNRWYV